MRDKKDKNRVSGRSLSHIPDPIAPSQASIGRSMLPGINSTQRSVTQWEDTKKNLLKMSLHFVRMQNVWGFGYWEWDFTETNFKIHPSNLWRSMGYQSHEILGIQTVEQILEYVHEEDRIYLQTEVLESLKKEASYEYSFRVRNRDGSYRWIQSRTSSLRDANNKIYYLAGVNYDISNEKRAEEGLRENQTQFQRILHSSNDGIWEWSRKAANLTFSQGCWDLLGYRVDDNTLGPRRYRLWRARIHPLDRPHFDQILRDRIQNGGEFDIEYRIQNKDKHWLWVRTRGDVIYDENGEVEYLAGANIDISALKKANERILSAKKLAEQANQAKSEFLSSMSHELRTPMNAILGFTQLFDYADNITEEQRENIQEIRKAGNQLLELINDVLELARIEAGKLNTHLEPVAISSVIHNVFDHCQQSAKELGVDLSYEPHHLASVAVKADKTALTQAIINLICFGVHNNHIGGRVIVSLMDTAANYLVISVRDTGKGVEKSQIPCLFEPFSRKSYESPDSVCVGIGLTIAKRLVELMNGNLEFESEKGIGSCFQIQLPLESIDAAIQHEVEEREAYSGHQNKRLFSGKRFLYIDEVGAQSEALAQAFQMFDELDFQRADEGVLGLYKARNMSPDAIIMDINMPGMDGYELLSILRSDKNTENIPVIALSTNATNRDMQKALDAGFSDFLTKPVDIDQITMVLNGLVNIH